MVECVLALPFSTRFLNVKLAAGSHKVYSMCVCVISKAIHVHNNANLYVFYCIYISKVYSANEQKQKKIH